MMTIDTEILSQQRHITLLKRFPSIFSVTTGSYNVAVDQQALKSEPLPPMRADLLAVKQQFEMMEADRKATIERVENHRTYCAMLESGQWI